MKLAVLLAAHGSRRLSAQASFTSVLDRVREIFPQAEARLALTSSHVRRRLTEAGEEADSVLSALVRLREEGFDHVAVQSLHVLPGKEFLAIERAARQAARQGESTPRLVVGEPLLAGPADAPAVARAALGLIPAERRPDEAVVFMGHGSSLPRHSLHAALQEALARLDPDAFVGVLEQEQGPLSLAAVMARLAKRGRRRVWLAPLLAMVGRHAMHDLAGEAPTSWKSRLEAAGIACRPVLTGALDSPDFLELWLERLRQGVDRLKRGATALGTLHGLGAGPGDPDLLTIKAARVLARAGAVFTAASAERSIVREVIAGRTPPDTPVEDLVFPTTRDPAALERAWEEHGLRVLSALRRGLDVVFVTLGDPLSWSAFGKLLGSVRALAPEVRVEVTPGVTAWQAAAAKAEIPLAEGEEILLVTTDRQRLEEMTQAAENVVLLKAGRDYPALVGRLKALGLAENALLCSRLGLAGETVVRGLTGEEAAPPYLSLVIVKKASG